MKKGLIIVVLLLILLTACQTVPVSEIGLVDSTPSSGITSPTDGGVPPTSAPPTTPTTTNPPEPDETGYTFIYDGTAPFISMDADYSGCTVGHLYWVDKTTKEVTPILEEQVLESIGEGAYIYYVKAEESAKIYRTPIGEFLTHEVIYESTHGEISAMVIDTLTIGKQFIMQFVADNKKFVVLDLNTGEDVVLMEQYYISAALFEDNWTDTWEEQNVIFFSGQPTENDRNWDYLYSRDTGEVRLENNFYDN